jgi:prephenate dehydrogenase
MGGSLSLSIRKNHLAKEVTGVVRGETSKQEGIEIKIADSILTHKEFNEINDWHQYDAIILGIPVDAIIELIPKIPSDYKGFITDLGSTKTSILDAARIHFQDPEIYTSSHPMCGSEETGLRFSNEELYKNKLCMLSPLKKESSSYIFWKEFWKKNHSNCIEIDPLVHDEALSYLSHAPHLLASLMCLWAWDNQSVQSSTGKSDFPLAGGGFRDMVRIAGSNPEMWNAIFKENKRFVYKSLTEFRDLIDSILPELNPVYQGEPDMIKTIFEKAKIDKNKIWKK